MLPDPLASPEADSTLLLRNLAAIRRRALTRSNCPPDIACVVRTPDGRTETAWVVNVSATGIGLLLGRPLNRDSSLLIRLRRNQEGGVYELSARVVHATGQGEGAWLVGCELAARLGDSDLKALKEKGRQG